MLYDFLGDASWPVLALVAVIVICLTAYSINESNHKDDVRKACVAAHGTLGESHGWPTCTNAR